MEHCAHRRPIRVEEPKPLFTAEEGIVMTTVDNADQPSALLRRACSRGIR
jgi:hypothetical protein